MPVIRRAGRHSLACGVLALAAIAALTGCVPEPAPGATSSVTSSPVPSRTGSSPAAPTPTPAPTPTAAPIPTPTPSATATAGEDITLPTACEQLYSAAMLALLQQQTPPLNDPGVTMYSTQVVGALEVLNSGVPTLRCSWGTPSEAGMATNVSIIDPASSAALVDALTGNGFACSEHLSGTLCEFEQESLTQDDTIVHLGESHFLRGNGWVSTAWITVDPDGYADDVIETLWR